MADFWKEFFSTLPSWAIVIGSILFLVLLLACSIAVGLGVLRFSRAMGKENKLIKLQEQLIDEKEKNKQSSGIASQLNTATENAETILRRLIEIRHLDFSFYDINLAESRALMQRIIDALASDIKYRPGERHRCGFWVYEEVDADKQLRLALASSGFPEYYIGNRLLDINHSVAGRSIRKNITEKIDNVTEDRDWQKNSHSKSQYSSIICIPIGNGLGVITIDALNPMPDEVVRIAMLYCRLFEGAYLEYVRLFTEQQHFGLTADEEYVG